MVAQNAVRTYGVNQALRFVEDIWLYLKSRQVRFFSEKAYFTSYVRHIFSSTILYEYHLSLTLFRAAGDEFVPPPLRSVRSHFRKNGDIAYDILAEKVCNFIRFIIHDTIHMFIF